jgi:prepilin signal peptidase PulO-like enzyme (type II secretory pathway)
MEILMNIVIFVLGLCAGSFVNMLVYRTVIGYKLEINKIHKVKSSRSFCDFCGRQLGWYENIPVLSWLVLRGKTKCCQQKLPLLYPVVEIGTGIMFLVFSLRYPWWQTGWEYLALGMVVLTLMIFLSVFDYKYMILPDFAVVGLIISALILVFSDANKTILNLVSAVVAAGLLAFLNLITKGRGMGWGDVKLAVFMGLWLGYPKIVIATYIAFVVGAVVSLFLMIGKQVTKKSLIPFGPFLILGTVISWWWGDELWRLIFG